MHASELKLLGALLGLQMKVVNFLELFNEVKHAR